MSQKNIDYSCTVIYKITCKDPAVTDLYVGHTTDFVKRRAAHKRECLQSDCKLYKTIRDNGGWTNWSMEALTFFNCKDLIAAKTKEQEYFVALKATLNSVEPLGNKKIKEEGEHICKICNINFTTTKTFNKHSKICKIKETKLDKNISFNKLNDCEGFSCEKCEFKCNKKSEWLRHTITRKHTGLHTIVVENVKKHKCNNCNKTYKSREGLWYHLKKCNNIDKQLVESEKNNIHCLNTMVLDLVKQNTELQKQIIEIINK